MKEEDIDLMLARGDDIVPSSGFAASVMEAVTRDAAAPPPIRFPWKRALPGLVWCVAVNILLLVAVLRSGSKRVPVSAALDLPAVMGGAGWIAVALVVSLVSVALSMRMARRA